jgi:hypothetical protein
VDVSYLPVRRVHLAEGSFALDATATWENVVEAQFAGEAKIAAADGRTFEVTLGGIVGREVAIVALRPGASDGGAA